MTSQMTMPFCTLLLGPLALSWVQDWYVDVNAPGCPGTGTQADPFCVLMDAVNAAADGDTIYIAPGTYPENVMIDKGLNLVGTEGRHVTILDGTGRGSVVRVEDASVTLAGLTLTNGTSSGWGGGLFVDNTASYTYTNQFLPTTLVSCSVSGNSANWYGGGIGAQYASLSVLDCEVRDNASGLGGGGIECLGQASIQGSTIVGNSASWGGGFDGGWVGYRGARPFQGDALTLTSSTISGNQASTGGGVQQFGSATIKDVSVNSNAGSGILCRGVTVLENLVVSGNGAAGIEVGPIVGAMGGYGDSFAEVRNALLVGNGGAGLSVKAEGHGTLVNSTLSRNAGAGISGDAHGPAYVANIDVLNSIVWDNALGSVVLVNGGTASFQHSLVDGGWAGQGNLDLDPLFADPLNGDFRLLPGSPCIDAGNNSSVPAGATTDIRGFPRFVDDPFTPDTGIPFRWRRTGPGGLYGTAPSRRPVVDLGAYEFP